MTKKGELVSVIVTNFNGRKYLKKCFDSLLKQSYLKIELIFADGHSSDESVEYVKRNFPSAIVVRDDNNLGLAYTNNHGASVAKGKYLLFLNNDTIVSKNFVNELVNKAKTDEKIGVVSPMQLPYLRKDDKNRTEDQKDNLGVGSDIFGYICTAKDAGSIFYPDAAIFIRADVFKKIDGFDNDFFLYGEDMDLCWRVHLLGYKIVAEPKATFRHDSFCAIQRNGRIQTSYRRRLLVERQTICKLLKYYQVSTLLWLLPLFTIYYSTEAFYFLIIGRNWKMFKNVYIRAIWWNLKKISRTIKKRRQIQSIRKVSDKEIMKLMYPRYRKLYAVRKLGLPIIK